MCYCLVWVFLFVVVWLLFSLGTTDQTRFQDSGKVFWGNSVLRRFLWKCRHARGKNYRLLGKNISVKLLGGQNARWVSSGPARNIATPSSWHLDSLQKRWPSEGHGNEESIPLFTPLMWTPRTHICFYSVFLSLSLSCLSSLATARSLSTCRCSLEQQTTVTWGRTPSTRCTGSPGKP